MVELPRASICAADLAVEAEFFSFGTNDLTQTSLGISRDDAGSFLHDYADKEIYPVDPFVSIDLEGVGTWSKWGLSVAAKPAPISSLVSAVNMAAMAIQFCSLKRSVLIMCLVRLTAFLRRALPQRKPRSKPAKPINPRRLSAKPLLQTRRVCSGCGAAIKRGTPSKGWTRKKPANAGFCRCVDLGFKSGWDSLI